MGKGYLNDLPLQTNLADESSIHHCHIRYDNCGGRLPRSYTLAHDEFSGAGGGNRLEPRKWTIFADHCALLWPPASFPSPGPRWAMLPTHHPGVTMFVRRPDLSLGAAKTAMRSCAAVSRSRSSPVGRLIGAIPATPEFHRTSTFLVLKT